MQTGLSGKIVCGLSYAYEGQVRMGGSDWVMSPDMFSAWLILKGQVRLESPSFKPATVGEGFWAIPPLGSSRRQAFSKGAEILSICFREELFGCGHLLSPKEVVRFPAGERPELERLGRSLTDASRGRLDYPANHEATGIQNLEDLVSIQARFWAWLEALLPILKENGVAPRKPSEIDPRIEALLPTLEKSRFSDGVPYGEIESMAGLGRVQIDRLFKKDLGCSPHAWMEKRVFDFARERLLQRSCSVKELSEELGFKTPSHFCAWFKKLSGKTPGGYSSAPR